MSASAHTVEKDLLVNNKYRITRRIGGGSFGEIYEGVGPKNKKATRYNLSSFEIKINEITCICNLGCCEI